MEGLTQVIYYYNDYLKSYSGNETDYHQLHIFTIPQIRSMYFDPSIISHDQVQKIAEDLLISVRERSSRGNKVTLFENNGKYLLTEYDELVDPGEMLWFNAQHARYEIDSDNSDLFDYIGDIHVDALFNNVLKCIGATDLIPVIEPHVASLKQKQERIQSFYAQLRLQNEAAPKLMLEIYRIEKNYKPVKIKEVPCHDEDGAICLPEHRAYWERDNRVTFLLRDIERNQIVYGNLADTVEGLKHEKWVENHPGTMDLDDMHRMELDNDNPDFLDVDNAYGSGDDDEEGDKDYEPKF